MPSFLDKLKTKQLETHDRPPGTPKEADDGEAVNKVLETVTSMVTTKRKLRKKV